MPSKVRERLTFANIVSAVALFLALGGSAWAVATVERNSVDSRAIVNGQVKKKDLRANAVSGAKIKAATITAADVAENGILGASIDEATLGKVPQAATADSAAAAVSAQSADTADDADLLDGSDSSDFEPAFGDAPWHLVGTGGEPPFTQTENCTWENYNNGWAPVSFVRDQLGFVHLRGRVYGYDVYTECQFITTLSRVVFHLPPGFRPDGDEGHAVVVDGSPGFLYVLSDGQVRLDTGTAAQASQWLQLDGITWRCGPSGANGCP